MGEQKKHSIGVIFPDGRVEIFTTYLSLCLQYFDEQKRFVIQQKASRYKTPFTYKGHIIGKLNLKANKTTDSDLNRRFKHEMKKRKLC